MARRPRPLATDREERLFIAAANEFLRHGFDAASLNRIIDTAGMAKSSFYHYFSGKRDLHGRMLATLTEAVDDFVHPPELKTLDADAFWPAMGMLLEGVTRMATERPETIELARLFHALPEGVDSTADDLRSAAKSWTKAAIERGAELGVVRIDLPPSLLAEIAFSVLVVVDRWALRSNADAKTDLHTQRALQALRELLEGR